jgi:hypothetical protein
MWAVDGVAYRERSGDLLADQLASMRVDVLRHESSLHSYREVALCSGRACYRTATHRSALYMALAGESLTDKTLPC